MLKDDLAEIELLIHKGTPVTIILNSRINTTRNHHSSRAERRIALVGRARRARRLVKTGPSGWRSTSYQIKSFPDDWRAVYAHQHLDYLPAISRTTRKRALPLIIRS
jgi:hypothetical protein